MRESLNTAISLGADGRSGGVRGHAMSVVPALNKEQQRSQISSGHRLIRLARQKRYHLYNQEEFLSKAIYIAAEYWLDHFMSSLRARMNEAMAQRVNAAVARARTHSHLYGVKKAGVPEFVAEAFFDSWWFKPREANLSRAELRDDIKAVLEKDDVLHLHFPILSRKPFCPLKNRGPYPDLAELHSLARCAEAAQIINALSPTGCQLIVLADGFKYNRACKTPDHFVSAYQDGLRFWINQLNVGDIVNVVNYEQWVTDGISRDLVERRRSLYERYCLDLTRRYSPLFDPVDLQGSLAAIQAADDIGNQIDFTFWSIISSIYYEHLFSISGGGSLVERHYGDDSQKLYISYASSLHRRLDEFGCRGENLTGLGYLPPRSCLDLFRTMRQQAWEAAIRYVAVSLTDRHLNLLRLIDPHAIKLTVHAKKGELHFLSATQQDANMTAQHCTGGLALSSQSAAKVTFRYRLERESQGEHPILLQRLPDTSFHKERYGPLHGMQMINQPIGYVADPRLIGDGRVHSFLTRRG